MKTSVLLWLSLLIVLIPGCGTNDDDTGENNPEYEGDLPPVFCSSETVEVIFGDWEVDEIEGVPKADVCQNDTCIMLDLSFYPDSTFTLMANLLNADRTNFIITEQSGHYTFVCEEHYRTRFGDLATTGRLMTTAESGEVTEWKIDKSRAGFIMRINDSNAGYGEATVFFLNQS